MGSIVKSIVVMVLCCVFAGGCTDFSSMLAGGAKGFCTHNPGSGPCVLAPSTSTAPPR